MDKPAGQPGPACTERAGHVPSPSVVADAWELLAGHQALTWVPPAYRSPGVPAGRAVVVHSVEQNLLVRVEPGDGHVRVRLGTGPLTDRVLPDGVDPLVPVGVHDGRLDVEADTFEDALCALAVRVVQVYGPPDAGPAGPRPGVVRPSAAGTRASLLREELASEADSGEGLDGRRSRPALRHL